MFNNLDEGDAHPERRALRSFFTSGPKFALGFAQSIDRSLTAWPDSSQAFDIMHGLKDIFVSALLVPLAGGAAADLEGIAAAAMATSGSHFEERYNQDHSTEMLPEDIKTMETLLQAGKDMVYRWRTCRRSPNYRPDTAEKFTLLALMSKAGFSDEEMAATSMNSLIAAAEAMASGVANTLQELVYDEKHLQMVFDEVKNVADSHGDFNDVLVNIVNPSSKDSKRFQFVTASLLEGMRLRPPATLVTRACNKDIEIGGFVVPNGTTFGICLPSVHASSDATPDPSVFNPSRALNYRLLQLENPFISFSTGPRGCPGKHIALVALKIALAKIVQKYVCSATDPGAPPLSNSFPKFVNWRAEGMPMNLALRENHKSSILQEPVSSGCPFLASSASSGCPFLQSKL
jgi:cytochrome P450